MELPLITPREGGEVRQELTSNDIIWLSFRNKQDHLNYRRFRVQEVSLSALVVLSIVSTIVQLFFAVHSSTSSNTAAIIAIRFLRTAAVLPGWFLVYYLYRYREVQTYYPTCFANIYTILLTVSACISLMSRVLSGRCGDNVNQHDMYKCNPEADVNMMPQDGTFTILIQLVVLEIVVKCVEWWAVLISWIIGAATIIAGLVIVESKGQLALPLIMVLILCLLFEVERSYMRFYVIMHNNQLNLRTTMQTEFQRQVIEQQAVEMRHLLGNVAHDMKTPVQSFVMDLEHLEQKILGCKKKSESDERCAKEILDIIQNLNDTNVFMRMIINRAIDYTKCSSGTPLLPSLHTVDWYDQVQNIVKLVQVKSRVPITLCLLDDNICSHIITDKQWLIENMLCLVANAVKFTMEGEVTVRCSLIESETSRLVIEVEDTGIGIPEDKRESMFRPLQQAMRMAGGTGLGLYSLSLRMKALGGECGLRDRSDGKSGICVWFAIPYVCGEVVPSLSCSTSTASSDENIYSVDHPEIVPSKPRLEHELLEKKAIAALMMETPRGVMDRNTSRATEPDEVILKIPSQVSIESSPLVTVLLVDDSPIIRKSVSRSLTSSGCIVELAENGEVGLNMMKAKKYDLVLMDIQMPVMGGLDATKALRQYEMEMRINSHDMQRIIGVSAYHGDEMGSCCTDCGMQGFIEKPFTQKQLVQCCYEFGIDCFRKHV